MYSRNIQKQLRCSAPIGCYSDQQKQTQYDWKESRREAQQELDVYVVELEQQNCKTQPHAGGKECDRLHHGSALHTKTSAEKLGKRFALLWRFLWKRPSLIDKYHSFGNEFDRNVLGLEKCKALHKPAPVRCWSLFLKQRVLFHTTNKKLQASTII